MSSKLGLNPNQVFPVRSYSIETECDLHIDILNLRAQRQILRNSKSYLKVTIIIVLLMYSNGNNNNGNGATQPACPEALWNFKSYLGVLQEIIKEVLNGKSPTKKKI